MERAYRGENMDFVVLGRAHVELEAFTPKRQHVTISITDPATKNGVGYGEANLFPSEQRLDTLRLEFYDITESTGHYYPVSKEQAQQIVDFIKEWKDKVKLIVVHCEAGISRSAAVAAALSKWLNNEDLFFFENFCPNSVVYNYVLESIYGNSWEQMKTEYSYEKEDIGKPLF